MYGKHQLYLDDYKVKNGVVFLPTECYWMVKRHIGGGNFIDPDSFEMTGKGKGTICLILNQEYSAKSGFWPVMSFLTEEEAQKLRNQLDQAIRA